MQYTIRGITEALDRAARERAEREGVSLNQVLVRALQSALGVEAEPSVKRDLSDIAGQCSIDGETRSFFEVQRQVDPEDWD